MKSIYKYKGNGVYCDQCSADFTNSDRHGGVIIGSWGYCPDCTLELARKQAILKRPKPVYCPANSSFKDFVLNFREKNSD